MINGDNIQRVDINYWDGLNTSVASNLRKKTELAYCINARSDAIGSISKRTGTHRLGDSIVGTANYGIFYFENSSNNGFYRITTVGATTSMYYLNNSAVWTALTGNGTTLTAANFSHTIAEGCCFLASGSNTNRYIDANGTAVRTSADIGDSTTQFDSITNTAGNTFRYTYVATGTDPHISFNVRIGDIINITVPNFSAGNRGSFTVTGVGTDYFEVTNLSGAEDTNKTIGTGAIRVNNHLTGSFPANKVNYYKDRLYLGDYYTSVGSDVRYKNGIMRSSPQLGIVALVDGDQSQPLTTLKVTDLKYIYSDDVLDIYRAGSKIGTVIVTAKNTVTNTLTIDTFTTADLLSSDEVWVAGTYAGKRIFRWAENESGIDVKQYDSFRLSGGQNDAITMMTNIGDVMLIANKHNITVWNNSSLQNMDLGIGCVSGQGFVKNKGTLYFLDYTGVYSTTGGLPKLESAKVQEYFDGATKSGKEAAAMGKKGNSIFVSLGSVTLYYADGSVRETLSDVVLEKNIQQQNFFIHTGISATHFASYISSDDTDRLEYCDDGTNCNVFEFLYAGSVTDDESGTPKEILFRADTNNLTLNKPFEKLISPMEVIVESERGHEIQIFCSLDNGQFFQLEGNAIKGCSIFKIRNRDRNETAPPKCRNIALSIRDYSKSLCRITRVALIYLPTNEEEENRADNFGK